MFNFILELRRILIRALLYRLIQAQIADVFTNMDATQVVMKSRADLWGFYDRRILIILRFLRPVHPNQISDITARGISAAGPVPAPLRPVHPANPNASRTADPAAVPAPPKNHLYEHNAPLNGNT